MVLVNPQYVKALKGRKTDRTDAQWLATRLEKEPHRAVVRDGQYQGFQRGQRPVWRQRTAHAGIANSQRCLTTPTGSV